MSDRLMRIAKIAFNIKTEEADADKAFAVPPGPARRMLRPLRRKTCPLSSRDGNQDLLMEDLEQRIGAAVEAVRDAVTLLEGAGMERGEAALKLVAIVKSEIEDEDDGLPGGFGDNLPDSAFDPKQLEMGTVVELEHTNEPELAEEIAGDHLRELPDYYSRLKAMEEEGEKAMEQDATDDAPDIKERKAKAADIIKEAIMSIMKAKELIGKAMYEVDAIDNDLMPEFSSIARMLEDPKDKLATFYEAFYPLEGEHEPETEA